MLPSTGFGRGMFWRRFLRLVDQDAVVARVRRVFCSQEVLVVDLQVAILKVRQLPLSLALCLKSAPVCDGFAVGLQPRRL